MSLTAIGVGAWAIGGGGWAFGWGPQDDDDPYPLFVKLSNRGVNWIDTAAIYGLGHSEEIVGNTVKSLARKPFVFTKCERVWNAQREIGKSLKRDSIRKECEASLRRLQVDVIDLYQIHWPEPDEDIEEGWTAMAELQHEGKSNTSVFQTLTSFNSSARRRSPPSHRYNRLTPCSRALPRKKSCRSVGKTTSA